MAYLEQLLPDEHESSKSETVDTPRVVAVDMQLVEVDTPRVVAVPA